jgi:hypothetical protein
MHNTTDPEIFFPEDREIGRPEEAEILGWRAACDG